MSESERPEIRTDFRPRQSELSFDLEASLASVVSLRATIPDDAFTAPILGTERDGQGVLIRDDGLIVTVGYLITEAESVWLVAENGNAVAGHLVAYDFVTGLGLVQALGRLEIPAIDIGTADDLREGDRAIVAARGGTHHAARVDVVAKREFAGSWEYLLEEAIFTAPPHPTWSGAALIGADGRLAGIGSLYVRQVLANDDEIDGNMMVPIDLLPPIVDDLLMYGRTQQPARPWLGMTVAETENCLVVAATAQNGPAQRAGVEVGDVVIGVNGLPIDDLAHMFRRVWSLGSAGTHVPVHVLRGETTADLVIVSDDRYNFLKAPKFH